MVAPAISVVIPTLNASRDIDRILNILERQTILPRDIIVIDSQSDDDTVQKAMSYNSVRVMKIRRNEFNHGLTRHRAALETSGEYICFLTQDAIPSNENYLANIITPMESDSKIALVSARQIPKANARRFEQLVRNYNYPNRPSVRSKDDLDTYGIKTFFASDACSAYRRTAYFECGGFPRVNTNEDMLMAAFFIAAGWKVAYEPTAAVYHSHRLTLRQQYNRNKQIGMFLEMHASDLMYANEIGEGRRLVTQVSLQLLKERHIGEFLLFGCDCVARLAGNRVGRKEASRGALLTKKKGKS